MYYYIYVIQEDKLNDTINSYPSSSSSSRLFPYNSVYIQHKYLHVQLGIRVCKLHGDWWTSEVN